MIPPFRPAIRPLMARPLRSGYRSRSQLMGELFAGCPSLLDSLVFYPIWLGPTYADYFDMISGTQFSQSTNHVLPSDIDPMGDPCGVFSSALSQQVHVSSLPGNQVQNGSRKTFGVWVKLNSISANQYIISKYNASGNNREYWLYYQSASNRFVWLMYDTSSSNSDSVVTVTSDEIPIIGKWYLVLGDIDPVTNRISIRWNNHKKQYSNISYIHDPKTSAFSIGYNSGTSYADAAVGPTPIWQRLLSDQEALLYYNNGLGLSINEIMQGLKYAV